MRAGDSGRRVTVTPNTDRASATALTTAGGAPMAPPSPAPEEVPVAAPAVGVERDAVFPVGFRQLLVRHQVQGELSICCQSGERLSRAYDRRIRQAACSIGSFPTLRTPGSSYPEQYIRMPRLSPMWRTSWMATGSFWATA